MLRFFHVHPTCPGPTTLLVLAHGDTEHCIQNLHQADQDLDDCIDIDEFRTVLELDRVQTNCVQSSFLHDDSALLDSHYLSIYRDMAKAGCWMQPIFQIATCLNDPNLTIAIPGAAIHNPMDRTEEQNTTLLSACEALERSGLGDCVNDFELSSSDQKWLDQCTNYWELADEDESDTLNSTEYATFLASFAIPTGGEFDYDDDTVCEESSSSPTLSLIEAATFHAFAHCMEKTIDDTATKECIIHLPPSPRAKAWALCLTSYTRHCQQSNHRLPIGGGDGSSMENVGSTCHEFLTHGDTDVDGKLTWDEYRHISLEPCDVKSMTSSSSPASSTSKVIDSAHRRFRGLACRSCLAQGEGFQCCFQSDPYISIDTVFWQMPSAAATTTTTSSTTSSNTTIASIRNGSADHTYSALLGAICNEVMQLGDCSS